MIRLLSIIVCIFANSQLFAQIKKQELVGDWASCNKDSLYYTSDTIRLYQDNNYYFKTKCCYYVHWNIFTKGKMKIENSFMCVEPGRRFWNSDEIAIELKKNNGKQFIILKKNGAAMQNFLLLSFEKIELSEAPYGTIKVLTLKKM